MLKLITQRSDRPLGFLDYGLSALSSCLAVYSLGMGLSEPMIGWYFVGITAVGMALSFLFHRFAPKKILKWGGLPYGVIVFLAFVNRDQLNSFTPSPHVPRELIIAAALAYMIALGSFAVWEEGSLMFQSVPTVAVFGLVGAWDTFQAAPVAFFGFLLCFATLFSRAHARLMIAQVGDSGYAEEGESEYSLLARLREGPWKFVAGPAWALGSALAVVILSLIGAPLIRASVQGVAGTVKMTPPGRNNPNLPLSDPRLSDLNAAATVGTGPRGNRHRPVFIINLKEPAYLRLRTYDRFTSKNQWQPVEDYADRMQYAYELGDEKSLLSRSLQASSKTENLHIFIRFVGSVLTGVPVPGSPDASLGLGMMLRPDGTVRLFQQSLRTLELDTAVPANLDEANVSPRDLPAIYYGRGEGYTASDQLKRFVANAIKGMGTDREKAEALKQAIENQVGYDLQAEAVPEGKDAVDHFLFQSKRGYCDLFATAMVRCAREAGLPARYVTGFYPALNEKSDGMRVLNESEAHAWCEIFFDRVGWVAFDPTEGAPNLGRSVDDFTLLDNPIVKTIGVLLIGLGLVVGPYFGARWLASKRAPADPVRKKLGKAYSQFLRAVERKTRHPRRMAQTPLEYVEAMRPHLGDHYEGAAALTRKFVASFYGPEGAPADQLLVEARTFAKACRR